MLQPRGPILATVRRATEGINLGVLAARFSRSRRSAEGHTYLQKAPYDPAITILSTSGHAVVHGDDAMFDDWEPTRTFSGLVAKLDNPDRLAVYAAIS